MLGVSLLLFPVSQGRQKAWKMGAGLGPTGRVRLVFAGLDTTIARYAEAKQKLPWSCFKWRRSWIPKLLSGQ